MEKSMTQQDNIQIVRHIFEAWNKHDPDRYVKLLDEKHVVESDTLPAPLTGREAGRQFMQMYVSAFPDLHFAGRTDGHQADESAHRDPRLLSRPAQERQSRARLDLLGHRPSPAAARGVAGGLRSQRGVRPTAPGHERRVTLGACGNLSSCLASVRTRRIPGGLRDHRESSRPSCARAW